MKILIATGLYPPDIGGPAEYAKNLQEEFARAKHSVAVVCYSRFLRAVPFGIRHIFYFFKVLFRSAGADFILALDTFSVAVPAVYAGLLLRKPIIIRVSGDFLWESYVERSKDLIPFRQFYERRRPFVLKERIIFRLMGFALRKASWLAFNSEWQRQIMIPAYGLDIAKTAVIKNFFGDSLPAETLSGLPTHSTQTGKNFIWAVRPRVLKNGEILRLAFAEAKKIDPSLSLDDRVTNHNELMSRLASCYAVILPSISEMSPNFIFDALRFGKPFILTRETGAYEMLKDFGLFVDPLNPKDIAEKILALSDPSQYAIYKSKAESFAVRHSWKEIADEFLALVKKV